MPGPGGGGTERLGEKGLADTDGSDEEDVLSHLEEVEREELVEVAAIDLDGGRPVEGIEGDALLEAGSEEPTFEGKVVATLGRDSSSARMRP